MPCCDWHLPLLKQRMAHVIMIRMGIMQRLCRSCESFCWTLHSKRRSHGDWPMQHNRSSRMLLAPGTPADAQLAIVFCCKGPGAIKLKPAICDRRLTELLSLMSSLALQQQHARLFPSDSAQLNPLPAEVDQSFWVVSRLPSSCPAVFCLSLHKFQ